MFQNFTSIIILHTFSFVIDLNATQQKIAKGYDRCTDGYINYCRCILGFCIQCVARKKR